MTSRAVSKSARNAFMTVAVLCTLASVPHEVDAQCTSGSCPPCTMCRVLPASGSNLPTVQLSALFDQIAQGPTVYGTLGWNFAGATTFHSGSGWCGIGTRRDTVPVHFPCLLLKAIYVTESGWRQFCTAGQTVISFDCGYGIAQVTSGMRPGNTSAFDPDRVAAEPAYNVSVGSSILKDKWRASPCVGDNNPDVVEDWYFATWGYNGFAFSNNPNNPMFRTNRPEYRSPGIASAQVRGNYPYQEVVWGYSHYPPSAMHYTGVGLAYPDPAGICTSCGFPNASIPEPAGAHTLPCGVWADAGTSMDASVDSGVGSDSQASDVATDSSPDAREAGIGPNGPDVGCGCRVHGKPTRAGVLAVLLWTAWMLRRKRQ